MRATSRRSCKRFLGTHKAKDGDCQHPIAVMAVMKPTKAANMLRFPVVSLGLIEKRWAICISALISTSLMSNHS